CTLLISPSGLSPMFPDHRTGKIEASLTLVGSKPSFSKKYAQVFDCTTCRKVNVLPAPLAPIISTFGSSCAKCLPRLSKGSVAKMAAAEPTSANSAAGQASRNVLADCCRDETPPRGTTAVGRLGDGIGCAY